MNRRDFMRGVFRGASLIGLGGVLAGVIRRAHATGTVWQIDPWQCTQCGKCATECVLEQSAVKCVHSFDMCGYCQLCTGYFEPQPNQLNTAAENQLCPTGAISFGDLKNKDHKVSELAKGPDAFRLLEKLGLAPQVYYVSKREWVRKLGDNYAATGKPGAAKKHS